MKESPTRTHHTLHRGGAVFSAPPPFGATTHGIFSLLVSGHLRDARDGPA